ncbi:MAG: light-harvesting protein [Pseudomonadota bacterium]
MADSPSPAMNRTGLTDDECKEVHDYICRGMIIWGGAAFVAHVLVYSWLPWFP